MYIYKYIYISCQNLAFICFLCSELLDISRSFPYASETFYIYKKYLKVLNKEIQ